MTHGQMLTPHARSNRTMHVVRKKTMRKMHGTQRRQKILLRTMLHTTKHDRQTQTATTNN